MGAVLMRFLYVRSFTRRHWYNGDVTKKKQKKSADQTQPLPQIDTSVLRGVDDGQPQSVIHAPTGFKQFVRFFCWDR